MKKTLLLACAIALLVTSGCSILKDLVKKTGDAINGVVAVPENVVTNSYATVKSAVTKAAP